MPTLLAGLCRGGSSLHADRGDTMSEQNLPPHVLTEIDSPIRETRLMGVGELARLANGADLAVAAAARLALQLLTEDDSRSVAAAAAAALERTAVRLNPDRVDFGQVAAGDAAPGRGRARRGSAARRRRRHGDRLRARPARRAARPPPAHPWQPQSDWLDGLGHRARPGRLGRRARHRPGHRGRADVSPADVEARLRAEDEIGGLRAARVTVLARAARAPPGRRRGAHRRPDRPRAARRRRRRGGPDHRRAARPAVGGRAGPPATPAPTTPRRRRPPGRRRPLPRRARSPGSRSPSAW